MSGAHMSSMQLARTVIEGQRVVFTTTAATIDGYLCGMDDYHWMVVQATGEVVLVHKAQTPVVTIKSVKTYQDEDRREVLEKIIGPFREHVAKTYFGRAVSVPQTNEELASC